MASNIVPGNIDGTYPKADRTTVRKDSEITSLKLKIISQMQKLR